MRRLLIFVVVLSAYACASTYYVSSSAGSDSNSGTSAGAAWKTLGKVNGSTFAAGDRILLARGDVWRETLTPPSSGASGNPIVFDAYGSGAAPEITGYQALTTWTLVSGNVWSSPVAAAGINYVLFGTIWGTKQTSQGALTHDRDFYLSSNTLYVFAASNPSSYYGTVAAILLSNSQLIYVNGKSWLTFQHIKLDWFDQFGVNVAGAADHLVFANMESDGMVPAGTLPHGFYVNASPGPSDIQFINDEAHLNYDGFRIDGSAAAIKLINCKGYANRDGGLVDNTGAHATYSYSHFYANGTGGIETTDVTGGIDGGNNLPRDTEPAVQAFTRYPARFSFTVDDVGLLAGTESTVAALVPVFNARGLKLNAAVVAGPTGVPVNTTTLANWVTAGHEIDSHSWSHQYFTDPVYLQTNHIYNSTNPTAATAFSLRYVGTGTAATVKITGSVLTTAITGGPGGQNLNINLASAAYDTLGELTSYITANYPAAYTVVTWTTPLMRTAAHSSTLADVTDRDIKSSALELQFDVARLMTDEATQSRAWLQANVAGLSNVKVYVYPDGVTDPAFEGAVAGAGYEGARGTLSMCASGMAPCSGTNTVVNHARAINVQNITSLTPVGWANYDSLTAAQLDAKVAGLMFRMRAWGYPVGLFIHANDYSDYLTTVTLAAEKTGWLLDSILAHGGTVLRNDELIEAVMATQQISGTTTYVAAAAGGELDFRPTPAAPGVDKGSNQGPGYGADLPGAMRPLSAPWDIGAYETLWSKHGGRTGAGHFTMGAVSGAIAFQSPTDGNIDETSAPAELLGLYGIGATFVDVTGNKVIRATDYSLGGGTTATNSFRANSDANDNVWSSDNKAVGICRTGGALYIAAFDPATLTVTPKGQAGTKGSCDGVSWSHSTPMSYFYVSGDSLAKATVDTTHATWTGAAGGNTNISAAINTSTVLDTSTQCPGLAYNWYTSLANVYGLDSADRYIGFGSRLAQDEGFQSFIYDAVNGCHWIDSRSMTQGGAWGASGLMTYASTVLLPVPQAPALAAVTGGTLTQGHSYTVCITETKSGVGETPCSATSSITVNAPNTAISVTPPSAAPANSISAATGFNVYVCDNTAMPGCEPVLQSNGTNASGALAQPTGITASCTTNCSGTIAYTFWVYASNAGGQSPLSAPFTTAATMGSNASFTLSVNQVANAATYTVFTDFTYNGNVLNNAGTCSVGVCTITVNTNPNAVGFKVRQNETVPIGTTPVITTLAATDDIPPITNTTGLKWHDVKIDGTGRWAQTGNASSSGFQAAYTVNPILLVDVITGVAVFGTNASIPSLNVGKVCAGHHVLGFGTYMGNDCNSGNKSVWTLNDSSAITEASEVALDSRGWPECCDEHFSAQMQSKNPGNPWFMSSDSADSHDVRAVYLANYMYATKNVAGADVHWKLCQNWQSGQQGFNSMVSGNISPDGKFVLFSSDMGVGEGVTSGQMGSTTGTDSCTDNSNCRVDAFICVTR